MLFARQALETRAFYMSMRRGDVGAMEYVLQVWCPQFLVGQQTRYGLELLDMRCGFHGEWDEQLARLIRSNWVINPWGKADKFLGLDEFMEELVRALKDQYNAGHSDSQDQYMRTIVAKCIVYFMAIKDDIRQGLGLRRRSGNHVKIDKRPDVQALVKHLLAEKIVENVEGRGRPTLNCPSGMKQCADLMNQGNSRICNGKFWQKFLMRSPGCSHLMKDLDILGNFQEGEGDMEGDGDLENEVGDMSVIF